MFEEDARLTSGLGYHLTPMLGAHRGPVSTPVEVWAVKGTVTTEGPEARPVSVAVLLTHLHPVLFGFRTMPWLVVHSVVTDLERGLSYPQEQSWSLQPFSSLGDMKLSFNMPCGFGGTWRRPSSFVESLRRLGTTVWAERYNSSLTVDVALPRHGRLRLELLPSTPPIWWRVELGESDRADVIAFPNCKTRGTLRLPDAAPLPRGTPRPRADVPVTGELYLEQVSSTRNFHRLYRNMAWFLLALPEGRRLVVYAITDVRGLAVRPQAMLCLPDGRLLSTRDVVLKPGAVWRSRETGRYYGTRWTVAVPSFELSAQLWAPVEPQEVEGMWGLRPFYLGGLRAAGRYQGAEFSDQAATMQDHQDADVLLLWMAGQGAPDNGENTAN